MHGANVTYEVTRIELPLASMTDDEKREAVWGLLREVASAADPARVSQVDVQMLGLGRHHHSSHRRPSCGLP